MKKLALILSTVGAGFLLVGGVVAAYVINDNADNTGITITPGTIEEDKTGTVTLSWGDMTEFTNIEGLSAGTPIIRTVNVIAELKDETNTVQNEAVYKGKLDVELKDLSGKTPEATKLIDYLTITVKGYAYDGVDFAENKSELGSITRDSSKTLSLDVWSNKDGKEVDFEVSLDSAATPIMQSINADRVYLSVDWNRGNADQGVKHVYIPDNGWENMYVYSYSDGIENKAWPGVQLERDPRTGLFVADLLAHEYFIFNDGGENQYPAQGLDGMTAESIAYSTANAIYFNWNTHKFVAEAPQTLAPFYLLGDITTWSERADFGFALRDEDKPEGAIHQWYLEAEISEEVAATEFKLRNDNGTLWLGLDNVERLCKVGDEAHEVPPVVLAGEGGNFKFNGAGTYEIYLKQFEGDNNFQIYVVKVGAPLPQELAPFYLVGEHNEWHLRAAYAFEETEHDDSLRNQWHLRTNITAEQLEKGFKVHSSGTDNLWFGLETVESISKDGSQDPQVDPVVAGIGDEGNFKFLAAGVYDIYVKQGLDYGYSVYIGAVPAN